MRAIRVGSVDPGGTTGYLLAAILTDPVGIALLDYAQPGDPTDYPHHDELDGLLQKSGSLEHLVCERFEHRNNEFALLVSLEYIGVVKRFHQSRGVPLTMQGSSQAKHWATNDKLDKLGLLIRPLTKWVHANDAARHLVYFLCAGNINIPDWVYEIRPALLRMLK